MALVPPTTGDLDEFESGARLLICRSEAAAQALDRGHREIEELGEHSRLDGFGRDHDHGLDHADSIGVQRPTAGVGGGVGGGRGPLVGLHVVGLHVVHVAVVHHPS